MIKKSINTQKLSGLLTAKYQYQTLGQPSHGRNEYIFQLNYVTEFYEKTKFWWVPPMNETIADIQVTKMDQPVNKKVLLSFLCYFWTQWKFQQPSCAYHKICLESDLLKEGQEIIYMEMLLIFYAPFVEYTPVKSY